MSGVFISYRREDSSGHAGWLREGLAERLGRDRVFMDIDTIEPGLDFVEVLERAVDDCDVLLVLIGKAWLTTKGADGRRRLDDPKDYHRLEVESALKRRIRVIPVLVQDATVPRAEELPPTLQTLARRHATELDDSKWAYDIDRLSTIVKKDLKDPSDDPRWQQPPPPPQAPPSQVASPQPPGAGEEESSRSGSSAGAAPCLSRSLFSPRRGRACPLRRVRALPAQRGSGHPARLRRQVAGRPGQRARPRASRRSQRRAAGRDHPDPAWPSGL